MLSRRSPDGRFRRAAGVVWVSNLSVEEMIRDQLIAMGISMLGRKGVCCG
jgi:hypothetical protein